MARLLVNDIVVLLPGIAGSRLGKDGKAVWDISLGALSNAILSLGGNIKRLELDGDDPEAEYADDGVRELGLMPDLHFLPGLNWRIDGYGKLSKRFLTWFDLEAGQNYFEFPYDWRRDNRAHAHRLRRQSREWLATWRARSGNRDARLILVAHSMGGLIARYFLECTEDGWRDTRMLITFGTPYSGSLNALDGLVNGQRKKLGPLTLIDLTQAMRSWPSAYQLLPTFRCIDNGGEKLERLRDRPLPVGLSQDAFASAVTFHDEIKTQVDSHLATEYEKTGGYDIRPVVGEFQRTSQSATLEGDSLQVLPSWRGADRGGDGTVPGLSSYPRELYKSRAGVMFAAQKHGSLQNDDAVLTQLYGLLRGQPVPDEEYHIAIGRAGLDLALGYVTTEPLGLSVRSDQIGSTLEVLVTHAGSGEVARRATVTADSEEWQELEIAPVPPGDYRVRVAGPDVSPVVDVCTVLPATLTEPLDPSV